MRDAFHRRDIARSRNEWLYPYDPLNAALPAAASGSDAPAAEQSG
jgi:hypothetical protein